VGDPAHVIFYRAVEPGLVEIVRVLRDRTERAGMSARENEEP
jgi:plasmid stabilization system protein ParE